MLCVARPLARWYCTLNAFASLQDTLFFCRSRVVISLANGHYVNTSYKNDNNRGNTRLLKRGAFSRKAAAAQQLISAEHHQRQAVNEMSTTSSYESNNTPQKIGSRGVYITSLLQPWSIHSLRSHFEYDFHRRNNRQLALLPFLLVQVQFLLAQVQLLLAQVQFYARQTRVQSGYLFLIITVHVIVAFYDDELELQIV